MKILEFFDYLLIEVGVALLNVGVIWETKIPAICYTALWMIFVVLFALKGIFAYSTLGRIVFISGQLAMMAVFLIFLLKNEWLNKNSFDMIALLSVFFLDLIYYLAETRFYCLNGGPQEDIVES